MPELAGPARGQNQDWADPLPSVCGLPKAPRWPRGAVAARAHRCPPVPMEREPGQTAGRGRLVSE